MRSLPASKVQSFRRLLLDWYCVGRRRLPWRRPGCSAYELLIAELLLRKTGVATVNQEYEFFITRFPTPVALGSAPLADIAQAIRRLGIADRARLLKALGQQLVKDHGGRVPRTQAELMALPGVGRYSANAVLCFAYRQPRAIVDTNVIRVLNRVFSLHSSKQRAHTDNDLWAGAQEVMEPRRSIAYNRAVLDFAATLCTHSSPRCAVCPISTICDYFAACTDTTRRDTRAAAATPLSVTHAATP